MRKKHDYTCDELMSLLDEHSDGDAPSKDFNRYSQNEYRMGVSTAQIRRIAREAVPSLAVSECLWAKNAYEARVLAVLLCPSDAANAKLVKEWLKETHSWAICDLIANELVAKNNQLFAHISEWSKSDALFVKRCSLSSIAERAKTMTALSAGDFEKFSDIIWFASDDKRKYVKSAASWAIRELGKIDIENKNRAIALSEKMIANESIARQWVGKDAMKELPYLIKVRERPRLLSSRSAVGKRYAKQA